MHVSLTPELEKYVRDKVKTGLYNSSSEVVRESLRLLEERDKLKEIRLEELRKEIQKGVDSIERGDFTEVDLSGLGEFFDGLRKTAEKKHRSQNLSDD